MLLAIHIKDIALIRSLELNFAPGMNILSGETGAGKSILIDALALALGRRGGKELVRSGSSKARVEALFDLSQLPQVAAVLQQEGIDLQDDSVVLVRELSEKGRSICRINGSLVPIATLRRVGDLLVDIHGQHASQAIFDVSRQLEILDQLSGARTLLEGYRERFHMAKQTQKRLLDYEKDESKRLQRIDLLSFQVQELTEAALYAGEEEELLSARERLRNAQHIQDALLSLYDALQAGEPNALSLLSDATQCAQGIQTFDARYAALHEGLESAYYTLEEIALQARDLKNDFEYDPAMLDEIEERLQLLSSLKRKYGASVEDMLAYLQQAQQELEELEQAARSEMDLQSIFDAQQADCLDVARELRRLREEAARQLAQRMQEELEDLGLKGAKFDVHFAKNSQPLSLLDCHENGIDAIEFYFSANPGQPMASLARTISGGEASRVMLALKNIIAMSDLTPTLVFDEIDAGISGQMAYRVAQKLANIAKQRQVLCITHLVQIAAVADAHFLIEKSVENDDTVVRVRGLSREQSREELARLSGALDRSPAALLHVDEIVSHAQAIKHPDSQIDQ